MFSRFDANKSTKGASKLRRDLINAEIANLRDLLPLPPSTRQRLSQLQLMALVCVYVRKANYFQQAFKCHDMGLYQTPTPNVGFSKALSGFLMMMTQNGKLLYISDNAAEYLGHSMEDLLIHGDSVYDIIDKQDHQAIQSELRRSAVHATSASVSVSDTNVIPSIDDSRMFLCRINVSRNARRQMRFGDQKVVLVRGHYLSFLPLCSRNEPVFLATCTPIAMPETRECIVQGATNVFTSIHSMDMKFIHIDKNGEFHLDYSKSQIQGTSWYKLLHWECIREAQAKHGLITQNDQDRSCILLVRLHKRTGEWMWVHCVLQVKENIENSQQPVIVCTNQVLSEHEANVMRTNSWLYHYYMVQSKLQYGLTSYDTHSSSRIVAHYHGGSQSYAGSYGSDGNGTNNSNQRVINSQHQHQNTYLHSPSGSVSQHNLSSQQLHGYTTNGALPPTSQHHQILIKTSPTDSEPVDYSVHNHNQSRHSERHSPNDSFNDGSQIQRSSPIPVPLYNKRKTKPLQNLTMLELEPIKTNINDSPRSSPSAEVIMDLDRMSVGSSNILIMPSVPLATVTLQHTHRRSRLKVKASLTTTADPADFMEQWNPSPPWSDTLQKVPDIGHQDLSPCVTTTPPTPHSSHMAFTFDWMPEQYVPNLGMSVTTTNSTRAVPVSDEDYNTHPEHHRLYHYHYNYRGYQQPNRTSATATAWPTPNEQCVITLQSIPVTTSNEQLSPTNRSQDPV